MIKEMIEELEKMNAGYMKVSTDLGNKSKYHVTVIIEKIVPEDISRESKK